MTTAGSAPPPRARSVRAWAAIGLLVAAPCAFLAVAGLNFLDAADANASVDRQEAIVAQLEARVRAGGTTAPPADAGAVYLGGQTPALARAELQRRLVDAVETAGGRIIEAQDDQPGEQVDLTDAGRARLRLTFDARNAELLALLHGIETGLPLLIVEKIEIRKLETGTDGDPEDPSLRVSLLVAGSFRAPTG